MGAPPLLLGGRLSHKGKRGVIANVPRDVTSPVCLLNGARFSTGPFSKGAPLPGATPKKKESCTMPLRQTGLASALRALRPC